MNSEELELSLRSEFENYLNGVREEMRQKTAELQNKFEAEIDNHRSTLAEAFRSYSQSFDSEQHFDEAFKSSVLEHLRLARDEGSKVAATAMAEAEEMEMGSATESADYSGIRDALNDISSHDSQSAILKALVQHSAEFAPRGAFFIVKNEQFVGWKVFGADDETAETAIREISFPMTAETIVGNAVRSLSTIEGSFGGHDGDGAFLDPLQFGQPHRMYAIPLVARGRGVAVMYLDYGAGGIKINVEAIETLMRVAGLTVELLAANQTARFENRETGSTDLDATEYHETPKYEPDTPQHTFEEPATAFGDDVRSEPQYGFDRAPQHDFGPVSPTAFDEAGSETAGAYGSTEDYSGDRTAEFGSDIPTAETASTDYAFEQPGTPDETPAYSERYEDYKTEEQTAWGSEVTAFDETPAYAEPASEPVAEYSTEPVGHDTSSMDTAGSMDFGSGAEETSAFDNAAPEFEPAVAGVGAKPEASIEVSPANTGYARLSNRPVDLPIEVAEDERRLHNDARRFARLLVSEIKLYNEKKVQEGRQSRDLYERLREAIDRSREMYDKRVQPPVAAKFDYFHYELVNALADGEVERLGAGYPGSAV